MAFTYFYTSNELPKAITTQNANAVKTVIVIKSIQKIAN